MVVAPSVGDKSTKAHCPAWSTRTPLSQANPFKEAYGKQFGKTDNPAGKKPRRKKSG